jgi:hypothetical protein
VTIVDATTLLSFLIGLAGTQVLVEANYPDHINHRLGQRLYSAPETDVLY